jgi:hypothetical protein
VKSFNRYNPSVLLLEHRFFATEVAQRSVEKDYYRILNIETTST